MADGGRLFTFGCSFTEYFWPTWADLVWLALGKPEGSLNYGVPGCSNEYVFSSIMKADDIHNINSNDIVIVYWSAWPRDSFFSSLETRWLHCSKDEQPARILGEIKSCDIISYAVRDLSYVKAVHGYLKHKGCEFYTNSLNEPILTGPYKLFDSSNYAGWYSWEKYSVANPQEDNRRKHKKLLEHLKYDTHPSPYEHWKYSKAWLPAKLICDSEQVKRIQAKWEEDIITTFDTSEPWPHFRATGDPYDKMNPSKGVFEHD